MDIGQSEKKPSTKKAHDRDAFSNLIVHNDKSVMNRRTDQRTDQRTSPRIQWKLKQPRRQEEQDKE